MSDATDIDPVGYDGHGAPVYGWQVSDMIPDHIRTALAEVRTRLEQDQA